MSEAATVYLVTVWVAEVPHRYRVSTQRGAFAAIEDAVRLFSNEHDICEARAIAVRPTEEGG